jgi:MFS family permease
MATADFEPVRLDARTLWTLLAGNALTAIGIGFFLPILPLFLRSRGGAPLLVGLVFAAGVAGRTASQYPAGWLATTGAGVPCSSAPSSSTR